MGLYVLRRLAGTGVAILVISFVAYLGLTFATGDAAEALIGEHASQEQLAALREKLDLDRPVLERYARFVSGAVTQADLGRSLVSGRSVGEIVAERFPFTLILALTSMGLAVIFGAVAGVVASTMAGGRVDFLVMAGTGLGLAMPVYWAALLLMMLFSLRLGWLPVFGSGSPAHLVLPAVTLALPAASVVARLVRSSLLEVGRADFVRTARSKGLGERQVYLRHIFPNSLIPVITVLGLHLGHLLGGSFVIETIFAWPGLGRLMVQAIFDRDIPVVMGAVLLVAPMCLLINLVVDIIQAVVDPRVGREAL